MGDVVGVPVFALTGDRDLQVNPNDLDRMRELVADAPLEAHRPTQINHVLRSTDSIGSPTEYRKQVKAGQRSTPAFSTPLTAWSTMLVAV